ncbi:MAG: transporter [Acidobacteriota bacterium]
MPRNKLPRRGGAPRARMRALCLPLLLAVPVAAWAGRPFVTEDACVSEKGEVSLEAGFETWETEEKGRDRVWVVVPAVGVGGGVELFAEVPFVTLEGPRGESERGFGDLVLGAKVRLVREETGRPGLALRFAWKTHTADARMGLGTGDNDLSAVLGASKSRGRSTLHLSVGFTREGDHLNGAVRDYAFYGGALEARLSERVQLCLEVQGSQNPERHLRENPTFALVGLSLRAAENLVLDLGYRRALRGPGPRDAVLCGLSLCF